MLGLHGLLSFDSPTFRHTLSLSPADDDTGSLWLRADSGALGKPYKELANVLTQMWSFAGLQAWA